MRTPIKPKAAAEGVRTPDKNSRVLLYDTLSMLGFLLASIRTERGNLAYEAEEYVNGFKANLKHYKLDFPAKDFSHVLHYIAIHEWKNAYSALQKFSRAFGPDFKRAVNLDVTVPSEWVQLTTNFLNMIAGSSSRWNELESPILNRLPRLGNEKLMDTWRVKIHGDQTEQVSTLEDIVKQITGKSGHALTFPQKVKLRTEDPELNKKYNAAYNQAMKHYRSVLRNYILDHKNKPQPVPDVRDYIEGQGIHIHDLYKELDDLDIGSDGFFYTQEGDKILNRPSSGAIIGKFNSKYDPEDSTRGNNWVFEYRTDEDESNWTKAYTEKRKREAKTEKSEKVGPMLDQVPKARPKWIKDMLGDDEDRSRYALLTDICYLSCGRIGGDGYTKGIGVTYGISTLLVSHAKITKGSVTLEYLGKHGEAQKHVFSSSNKDEKNIVDYITYLAKGKKPSDMLFTHDDGSPVTDDQVRAYMKTLGVPHLTPHYMRSIRGTRLMRELMDNYTPEQIAKLPKPDGGKNLFEKEALKVGALLGHVSKGQTTATTAIKAYIDPDWAQDFFVSHGLRVPQFLKSMVSNKD